MNEPRQAIFIQANEQGTDVFFLKLSNEVTDENEMAEWEIVRQHLIPKQHVLDLFKTLQTLMPSNSMIDAEPDSFTVLSCKN